MSKTDMLFYRAIYCVIGAISFFGCQDKSIIASFMINYLEIEVIEIPNPSRIWPRLEVPPYTVLIFYSAIYSVIGATSSLKCIHLLVDATTKSVFIW